MRAFTYVAIALIAAAISVPSAGDAFAQAGSTGGMIGKSDKSISGGEERSLPTGRASQPAERASQPARRREQAPTSGSYDGSWAGMSVGPCIGHFGWNVQVSNGIISGNNTTGRISRGGATNGDMVVMGKHFVFKGTTRANGQASGTWISPNCTGSWTAVRS